MKDGLTPLAPGASTSPRQRILFDVYELAPGTGKSIGIYNYARHLFQALLAMERADVTLVLVCNPAAQSDFALPDGTPTDRAEVHLIGALPPSKSRRLQWLAFGAASACRRLRADLYFSPKGFLPFGIRRLSPRTRSVVTIHDLIPLWYRERYPQYFGRLEQWFICSSLERSARNADAVITISQASARDIVARTATPQPLHVVYNGLPPAEPGAVRRNGDYLFSVSSPLPHKNLQTLLRGYQHYRSLVADPLPLLLCGAADPHIDGVQVTGRLSDAELNACYAGARVFMFLSLTEGFGFPPLEAMSHGTAVICSDIEVHREVTGDAAIYVPAEDAEALGEALARVLMSGSEQTPARIARRRQVAQSYSWPACAQSFLAIALRGSV